MAYKKTAISEQLREHLARTTHVGRQALTCVQGQTGPSPLLTTLVMNVAPLVALLEGMRRYYLLAVTEDSVIVCRSNRATNRPGEVTAILPLDADPIAAVKKGKVWSRLYLQLPDKTKPTRFYVSPTWNPELVSIQLSVDLVDRVALARI